MSIFEGSAVALVTPFTSSGINFSALEKLLDFHINNGTDALLVCGTTGEPSTMTTDEKHSVIDFAIKYVDGALPVIAGTGANNTATAVSESIYADKAGADALLVVTPYYNKCSPEGLFLHYKAISDAVGKPIIVYNVPSRTGVNIAPQTMARLAELQNVCALKEACGDISQIAKTAQLCAGKIDIYSGNDDQIVPIMSLGGKGVISVLANVEPKKTHELCAAYLSGDTKRAMELQLSLNPLVDALFSDVNPIPVKTALNMMGYDCGPLRLPLCKMSESKTAALKEKLLAYGLLH